MAGNLKIIFSGAPHGSMQGLLGKVDAINKKNGPFIMLFACGQMFAAEKGAGVGTAKAAIPTYFVGSFGGDAGTPESVHALTLADSNLHYLGRAGVKEVKGLTVAYLDGTYNAAAYHAGTGPSQPGSPYYTEHDVQTLRGQLRALEGEVDILITCEWPKGVLQGVPEALLPPQGHAPSTSGSDIAAELAQLAKPRYHFASGQDVFFARLPYVNKDLGAGPRATRFIALAPVDSQAKQKSLHALNMVPSSSMDPDALSTLPEGCTPNPYETKMAKREAQHEALPEGDSWRWSKTIKRQRKEGRGGPGGQAQTSMEPPAAIAGRTDIMKDPYSTITARNVAFKANEVDIVHFFGQAGKVIDVIRTANREGKLNTWVSIQYATPEEAQKALQLHNTEFMGRTITVDPATESGRKQAPLGMPVEGCWFCLGSSSVDISLVASVGTEAYVTLDKGAISDHHVLLVPVDHFPSSVLLSPPCYTEMERYMSSLRTCYASLGMELVGFERHFALKKNGGNHCHINVVAVPSAAAKRAKQAFQQATEAAGFNLKVLPPTTGTSLAGAVAAGSSGDPAATSTQTQLKAAVGDSEYFCALLPDGTRMVRPIMRGERFPMNLGREVLASLVGKPERADWKACSVSEEEEKARTARFKELFKAYDTMLQ